MSTAYSRSERSRQTAYSCSVIGRSRSDSPTPEHVLEGSEDQQHGVRAGVAAHQPDAPDRGGVGPGAGADLDVVALEELTSHCGGVDTYLLGNTVVVRAN